MPDWFYHTVSRPILFRLPPRRARDIALGFMGSLARLPLGKQVINFLGHMDPDPRLGARLGSLELRSPLGLGPTLDLQACALPALSRFGFGFLEAGTIVVEGKRSGPDIERDDLQESILLRGTGLSLEVFLPRARELTRLGTPLIARLGCSPGTDQVDATRQVTRLMASLADVVSAFSVATLRGAICWTVDDWQAHLRAVREGARGKMVLLVVPAELACEGQVDAAVHAGFDGIIVDGCIQDGDSLRFGAPVREMALACVTALRSRHHQIPIVASGGIHEPEHATDLMDAGANYVQVDSGLVFTGPGLAKRANELLLARMVREGTATPASRAAEMSWFWTAAMGAGMVFGSILALAFAATAVVLPYDLDFVGMTREQLNAINPRLLHFMAHDRVSLAGTMVATGVMYLGLSYFGSKRGYHWARHTLFVSAFTGFASFFLFLGFGYLDPFHAFVTAALLQLLLLGVYAKPGDYRPAVPPERRGDHAWRLGLWGQFLLIVHGAGLLAAGAVISMIGVTFVFVPEDLAYLGTTSQALRDANPRLVPLIAHDRATLGGMLLASGWAFLLPALWGFRRGENWLWWTYMSAGPAGYFAAIGVHYAVCYTDILHLLPAFAGLGLLLLGLLLSAPYLGATEPQKPNPTPSGPHPPQVPAR
ncbi:MAG TPA: dihydroorotate dehydrogenase [Planctomycetota bacterium]|nr:dihydroorotate dehydrogenase [Planctomycetota bacterium]